MDKRRPASPVVARFSPFSSASLIRLAAGSAGLLALAAYTSWLAGRGDAQGTAGVMAAVFAAALISSVGGFAFSALCGAMLFHLIDDPVRAVQTMMICSVGGQAMMVWSLRRTLAWRELSIFLLGALAGLPLGLLVLLHTRASVYMQAVGVLIVAYAAWMILRRPVVVRRQHPLFDAAAGFLGGITGGAAAFPGAFVTIWCGFKGWSKERQRGLYQPFILIVQLAAIGLLALSSLAPNRAVTFDFGAVIYLPAVFVGVSFGMCLFNRLNERQFALAVNLLLIVSGASLLA
jgi:uncharacterized membrane protein YfcA